MTREDKIRVIHRWTRSFEIEKSSVGEYYAWVDFPERISAFHTDQYPSRDDLIDDSYSTIKIMVWRFITNGSCYYVYDY